MDEKEAEARPLMGTIFLVYVGGTADTRSVRIKVAYCVKRVLFPYLGNDSDGR